MILGLVLHNGVCFNLSYILHTSGVHKSPKGTSLNIMVGHFESIYLDVYHIIILLAPVIT